jgi:hypothetical protein
MARAGLGLNIVALVVISLLVYFVEPLALA